MKQQNCCSNCGHFIQYFRKLHSTFMPLSAGFCDGRTLTPKQKQAIPHITDCPAWEPIQKQLDHRRMMIGEALETIAGRLEAISQILRLDEECRKKGSHNE